MPDQEVKNDPIVPMIPVLDPEPMLDPEDPEGTKDFILAPLLAPLFIFGIKFRDAFIPTWLSRKSLQHKDAETV